MDVHGRLLPGTAGIIPGGIINGKLYVGPKNSYYFKKWLGELPEIWLSSKRVLSQLIWPWVNAVREDPMNIMTHTRQHRCGLGQTTHAGSQTTHQCSIMYLCLNQLGFFGLWPRHASTHTSQLFGSLKPN